jgi:hypothetical protein
MHISAGADAAAPALIPSFTVNTVGYAKSAPQNIGERTTNPKDPARWQEFRHDTPCVTCDKR